MARVFVTGLQGFTGPYVARAIEAAGYEVIASGTLEQFDVRDPSSMAKGLSAAKPDYVVHLAALSSVTHANAADLYAVNAVGTGNLLQVIADCAPRVRKILLASSANVYGNTDADPIDESVPPAPVNHYGCSKIAMEFIARTWFDRLPIVIARPFNYAGPGQSEQFLVPKLVAHYAGRRPVIELGNLDVERDFSDVRMLADAYTRLLTANVTSSVINICSGTGRSLRSLLAELRATTGHEPEIRVAPQLVRRAEVHRLVGSNRRLRDAIGELRFGDFSATLRWMVDSYSASTAAAPAR